MDAFRRLQIGLIGICAVLLLVGIASMATNRASNEAPVAGPMAGAPTADTTDHRDEPKEPLAELGVTPGGGDQPDKTPRPAKPATQAQPARR